MGELPATAARRPLWPLFALAIVLALLPRLAIVFSPRADLFGPPTRGEPNVAIGEELTRGDTALEIIEGPLLSIGEYQYAHFFGGSVISGIVAAPFFLVLGPSLWALKLAAISFHLIALCFGIAIADRWVSRRAAAGFAVLFACSPPGYTLLTTVAWGSHVESGLLALACTWLLLDLRDHPAGSRGRLLRRFSFGVCAGFSLWFGYQCALFLAALLTFELFAERRFWRARELAVMVAGTLLGLLPWWTYNLRNDWAGVAPYGTAAAGQLASAAESGTVLTRPLELVRDALPGGFFFPDLAGLPPGAWNGLGFVLLLGLSIAPWFLSRRPRPAPFVIAWLYLGWFALGFSVSGFAVGAAPEDVRTWRYALLPVPFLCLAAACGLDLLAEGARLRRRAVFGVAIAWGLVCLAGSASFIDPARAWDDRARLGGSQDHLGRWLALRFADEPAVLQRLCDRALALRTPQQQAELFGGMAISLWNFSRPNPRANDSQRARAEVYRDARDWMGRNAPQSYRMLFQGGAPPGSRGTSEAR